MSVVLIGMEMPESCWECRLLVDYWCYAKSAHGVPGPTFMDHRPDWCPLRPLPEKHGRLIDADELADGCDDPHWCRWLSEIEDMPTIVEAEGE